MHLGTICLNELAKEFRLPIWSEYLRQYKPLFLQCTSAQQEDALEAELYTQWAYWLCLVMEEYIASTRRMPIQPH